MTTVFEAVMLMAGSGSRLRGSDKNILKPLVPVGGRPLVGHTVDALMRAGIRKLHIVVGYESERLRAAVRPLVAPELVLSFIENPDWQKQNGISALAAAQYVTSPFLLTMSDHLFDQSIVDLVISRANLAQLNLAIDRKLNQIFDIDDAMKIQTRGERVIAIGKRLQSYDAVDTGLFVCPFEIFDYLQRSKQNGDCSLADGVRLMATDNKVHAIDIGAAWWQDVDTPEMLAAAEQNLLVRPSAMKTRWPEQSSDNR